MAKGKYDAYSDSEDEEDESVFLDPDITKTAQLINGANRYHAGLPPSLNGVPIVREETTPDWIKTMMEEKEEEKEEDLVITQNPLYVHNSTSSLQTHNGISNQYEASGSTSIDGIRLDAHPDASVTGLSSSYCAHHK